MKKYFKKIVLCFVALASLFSLASCGNDVEKGDSSKVKYFETIEECYIEYQIDQKANETHDVAVFTFMDDFAGDNFDKDSLQMMFNRNISEEQYNQVIEFMKSSLNHLTASGIMVYIVNTKAEDFIDYSYDHFASGLVEDEYNFLPYMMCKDKDFFRDMVIFFATENPGMTAMEYLDMVYLGL